MLRSAELEASAASEWYAERDAFAAERFRIALDEAVEQIARFPGAGHPVPGDQSARRVHLDGFPFWVLYEERPESIRILAVAHEKRNPAYWREP